MLNKVNITFGNKTVDSLAPKYHAAIDFITDERNNGDGWWIYLKEPYFNTNLECAIIHEQTLTECIQQLRDCVNNPVTKEQYFSRFKTMP